MSAGGGNLIVKYGELNGLLSVKEKQWLIKDHKGCFEKAGKGFFVTRSPDKKVSSVFSNKRKAFVLEGASDIVAVNVLSEYVLYLCCSSEKLDRLLFVDTGFEINIPTCSAVVLLSKRIMLMFKRNRVSVYIVKKKTVKKLTFDVWEGLVKNVLYKVSCQGKTGYFDVETARVTWKNIPKE